MPLSIRLLLAVAALSAVFTGPAHAEAYIVTYLEATPPATNKALDLLRTFGKASRSEKGNVRVEVLQRRSQPNHFAILEVWNDGDAQAAHAAAASTKQFREKLEPMLRSPYDERPHAPLLAGGEQAKSIPAGAVYVVTHVDIVPTEKDKGIGFVKQLTEESRKDPGNLRFDQLQQPSRPNHMTVVEVWRDQKAVDAHGMAAYTKDFRGKLLPLSGSLYDERLYKAVN